MIKKISVFLVLAAVVFFMVTTLKIFNNKHVELVHVLNKDKSAVELYLKNVDTEEQELFKTLYDASYDHANWFEYHGTDLYIKREVKADTFELWKYDIDKKSTKLYSSSGFNFRVSPNQKYIALESNNELVIIDDNGAIYKTYVLDQLKMPPEDEAYIDLLKWADDSKTFWGSIILTTKTYSLFKINLNSDVVDKWDISHLPLVLEYSLNPNTEMLVYSDFPAFFDAEDYENFKKSKKEITLYVYDLNNKSIKEIATSVAKEFSPTWINSGTIEFENPKENNRITYSITN